LLRRWHADKRNLLVLEQGVDAELALKPFMPAAIQVLECSFLSGIKARKVNPLLAVLKPKLVLVCYDLFSRIHPVELLFSKPAIVYLCSTSPRSFLKI